MKPSEPSLVLASASPRRRRLLQWLGAPYDSVSATIQESLDDPRATDPESLVLILAEDKARDVGRRTEESTVLAFDTIVVADGEILGKPEDRADARRMLKSLSGGIHQVITGCAILCPGQPDSISFSVATPVHMHVLEEHILDAWLEGDEALGCAGAYNIERHLASVELDQCFQNVAGMPLCHLYRELSQVRQCQPTSLASPVPACDSSRGVSCRLGPRLVGTTSV